MTLKQWAARQILVLKYRRHDPQTDQWIFDRENDTGAIAAVIPDTASVRERAAAFRLTDWRVTSVTGGSIWFVRRQAS